MVTKCFVQLLIHCFTNTLEKMETNEITIEQQWTNYATVSHIFVQIEKISNLTHASPQTVNVTMDFSKLKSIKNSIATTSIP